MFRITNGPFLLHQGVDDCDLVQTLCLDQMVMTLSIQIPVSASPLYFRVPSGFLFSISGHRYPSAPRCSCDIAVQTLNHAPKLLRPVDRLNINANKKTYSQVLKFLMKKRLMPLNKSKPKTWQPAWTFETIQLLLHMKF